LAALLGILGGVIQKVRKNLREAHGIRFQDYRIGRETDAELVTGSLDERPAGFDGAPHNVGEVDLLFAQFNFTACNAGDLHQVIHQADHVVHLAIHHFLDAIEGTPIIPCHPQDVQTIADWRQWV
jgi:hypothetical protein